MTATGARTNHLSPRRAAGAREDVSLPDVISRILLEFKILAVVGLSAKPSRPSHGVSAYMRAHGYRVIPVNPNIESVLNERCYSSLEEVPGPIDVVVIFRKPEHVLEIVEAAIQKRARVIWMQEGIRNQKGARRAREAGLEVVEDRCILKEHAKRFVTEGI
ncbi:MAG TPA: CoA-binding protein [Terriglobia bacterium]|nr:CoA-binding protein [Terriglobia bacterium]